MTTKNKPLPSKRKSPQLAKAAEYLRVNIAQETWPPGSRLPSIAQLAHNAGVSVVSLWKAVTQLAKSGNLEIRAGVGTFVPSLQAHSLPETSLTIRLLHDILEGRFHTMRELPSKKLLADVYTTNQKAVRIAVNTLIANGYIIKSGNHLSVKNASELHGISLLFICGPDFLTNSEGSYWRSTIEEFFKHFEQQCAVRNIRVQRCVVEKSVPLPTAQINEATGCIFWDVGSRLDGRLTEILQYAARIKKPSVLVDQAEMVYQPHNLPATFPFHIWSNNNKDAGHIIGNALLQNGHRAACFLAEKRNEWAIHRYEGICAAFEQAGYSGAVRWFSSDSAYPPALISAEGRQAEEDLRFITKIQQKVMNASLTNSAKHHLIARLNQSSYGSSVYCDMETTLFEALAWKKATAWISGDDFVALHAIMPFLAKNRIRIPQQLSLVSFNNQFESAHAGLSTFHFDMSAMAMRIVTFLTSVEIERLLRPSKIMLKYEGIKGFLVTRDTLGRAP